MRFLKAFLNGLALVGKALGGLWIVCLMGCGTSEHKFSGIIYTYGSSIMAGFDHPDWAENVGTAWNYKTILGANGGTSMFDRNANNQLAQYETIMAVPEWPSNAVIFWDTGINDAILHVNDPAYITQYSSGLNEILAKFGAKNVRVWVATPNHNCDEPRFGTNAVEDIYGNIAKAKVAALNNPRIKIIDFSVGFSPDTTNTVDCLHPNLLGYRQMSAFFLGAQ